MWNHTHTFKDLDRFFVGFDKVAEKMASIADQSVKLASNYPPYNIKKVDENRYTIEMAVAGFGKQDIELELVDDKLVIKGNVQSDEEAEWPQTLYRGLAMRPFTRMFNLADNVEIRGASLINGILKIGLEAIIPEHKKPKKIDINDDEDDGAASTKEFLAERKDK